MGVTLVIVEAKNSKGGLLALQFAVQPYLTKTDEWMVDVCLGHFFRWCFVDFCLLKADESMGFFAWGEGAHFELADVGA